MIEQAENLLRDLGFYDVRVRHHELNGQSATTSQKPTLHLARIEVGHSELPKFLQGENSTKVAEALRKIGYAHVTLDLAGYRRGSTNEVRKVSSAETVRPV
jgi:uncharacterized protein